MPERNLNQGEEGFGSIQKPTDPAIDPARFPRALGGSRIEANQREGERNSASCSPSAMISRRASWASCPELRSTVAVR
jgi:hypothetical protein